MPGIRDAVLTVTVFAAISCSSGGSGSAPAPSPRPTAAAAPAPAAPPAAPAAAPGGAQAAGRGGGGGGGAPGGGGRGAPPTPEQTKARRDSIGALRAETVKQLMTQIAGKENEPAGTVFKNVQLMKTVPAGQFLTLMDQGIGRALSRNCQDCHLVTDWASDSIPRKKTARIMMEMVNTINTQHLTKLGPGRGGGPRTVQCVTCHRGGGAGSTALLP